MPVPVPEQFANAIERFIRIQEGRNRSPQTLRAYKSDLSQLAGWLYHENTLLTDPIDVTTDDLNEFLAALAHRGVSGVSRARKLAAIREFYRSLHNTGALEHSPVDGVDTPKRERKSRTYLTPEEYKEQAKRLACENCRPKLERFALKDEETGEIAQWYVKHEVDCLSYR
jgi:site-specific recombinase XerD